MNKTFITIGRIIFALAIAMIGLGHFTDTANMRTYVPSAFSAIATPLVYFTGACVLLAVISFLINRYTKWAGILFSIYLIILILFVHLPGASSSDPATMHAHMSDLVKDAGLLGAALMVTGMSGNK